MRQSSTASHRGAGQAGVEMLIVAAGLVVLLFGPAWWEGDGGVAGVWLQAMRAWYGRFAAAIALPV